VTRCQAGDLGAFTQVYALYERPVFCYAYHLLDAKISERKDARMLPAQQWARTHPGIDVKEIDERIMQYKKRIEEKKPVVNLPFPTVAPCATPVTFDPEEIHDTTPVLCAGLDPALRGSASCHRAG
jgi:hypothetical protein